MLAFTLRRAIQAIGVMLAVGIIAFSMFRFAGDPVNQIVSIDTSAAERAAIRASLGLDDPVPVQFARYFANAAQFKFGMSYQFRQPVSNLLMERMPATLELAACATVFAMVFGMMPLAFEFGAGAEFRAPMARAVIGGLITSTLLTLIAVPVAYSYLDDFGKWLGRAWAGKSSEPARIAVELPAGVNGPSGD